MSDTQRATFGRGPAWAALLAAAGAVHAAQAPQAQDGPSAPQVAPSDEPPAAPGTGEAPYEPRYRGLPDVVALLDAWAGTEGVERLELGPSGGGARVPALVLGGPGPRPLAERPTVFLFGGLDGRSLAGTEAVLAATAELLAQRATLRGDLAVAVVPWAAPDGLAGAYSSSGAHASGGRPYDEDGDGALDEDGPDDLDGDGLVLEMLVEDPSGEWTPSSDPRFLVRARPNDAPRYRRAPEGRDDDGDGRFNEDGPGGVVLDRNFPVGWRPGALGGPQGPWPLSEPLARRYADLVLARHAIAVVLFQGNHRELALPGAAPLEVPGLALPDPGDAVAFATVAARLAAATGRPVHGCPLRELEAGPRSGAALDWIYAVAGCLAVEVSPWGPPTVPASEPPPDASSGGAPPPDPSARAWARWLDDERGGIGFVAWHAVDLGGRRALVGGWEPRTFENPPPELLPAALAGLPEFVLALVDALPALEVRLHEAVRDGELCRVSARVANRGALPTALATTGRWPGGPRPGCVLALEVPSDARAVAGAPRVELPALAGGATSDAVEWLVLAGAGTPLVLRAHAPWGEAPAREVRP